MELKEIQKIQKGFDKEHFKNFWDIKSDDDFVNRLEYLTVALAGEFGEFSNVVKKIARDHATLNEKPSKERIENLKEELTDCFIYLLIVANFLNVDLEKEYLKKQEFNRGRFSKYKK